MRRLLPSPADTVDLTEACAISAPTGRGLPWTVGLVASTADGAATIGGVSGPIGGSGDAAVFAAVRDAADAVVVGAGTAAAEGYGPVRPSPGATATRVASGRAPRPTLVVVSGRLTVPPGLRLFTEADPDDPRPVVVHGPAAPRAARERLTAVADVVEGPAGDGGVDPAWVLEEVALRGHRVAVVEGGPRLLGTVVAADLLDEMFVTIDPRVVGGDGPRTAVGRGGGHDRPWTPVHLLEHEGVLFWRLRRRRG